MNQDIPPLSPVEEELAVRYQRAAHAMQSGVMTDMQTSQLAERHDRSDPSGTGPKQLRTGVNSALVDSSALGKLLVEKGVIGREEYMRAMAEGMEAEQKRYEELLSERMKRKVTLG